MFILIMICVTLFILTSSQFRVYTILNSLTKLPSPIITWSHTTHHFIALSTYIVNQKCFVLYMCLYIWLNTLRLINPKLWKCRKGMKHDQKHKRKKRAIVSFTARLLDANLVILIWKIWAWGKTWVWTILSLRPFWLI